MAQSPNIVVKILGQDETATAFKGVDKNLKTLNKSLKDNQEVFKKVALAGTVAFAAIATEVGFAIKAFAESESQLKLVDSLVENFSTKTLSAFGGSMDSAKRKIKEFGDSMQAIGGISGELASVGLAKLLQVTQNYTRAQEGARLAADLAIFKNIDYASAIDVVGKVLSGNTSILQRYGIEIDENASSIEAITKLQSLMGGAYEKSGKTIDGQLKILKESFSDLQENIGKALAPALQKLIDIITPLLKRVTDWVAENPKLTATIFALGASITGLVAVLGTLGYILPSVINGIRLLGFALNTTIGQFLIALAPITAVTVALSALAYVVFKDLNYQTQKATEEYDDFSKKASATADRLRELREPLEANSKEMKALAEQSKNAKNELENVQNQIRKTTEEYAASQEKGRMSVAEAFIEQEKKISDLKKEIDEKRNELSKIKNQEESDDRRNAIEDQISELRSQLDIEKEALANHQEQKKGLEAEFIEARRVAGLTDFERKLEDLAKEKEANTKAFNERMAELNKEKEAKFAVVKEITEKEKKLSDDLIAEQERQRVEKVKILKQYEMDYAQHIQNLKDIENSKTPLSTAIKSVGDFVGNLFRADGGPVSAGKSYIVGEKGPEFFTPNSSGTIIPNNKLGMSGSGVTVVINNPVIFDESMVQRMGDQIVRVLGRDLRF